MSRALIILSTQADREKVAAWARSAKWNTRVEFKAPKRTIDQNSKLWACLTDVATQVREWGGVKLSPDDWKLVFLDALKRETGQSLRLVPNTDGTGIVNLSTSSSDLSKEEMSDLIEIIHAFGAKHGVVFNEPSSSVVDEPGGSQSPSETPAAAGSHSMRGAA